MRNFKPDPLESTSSSATNTGKLPGKKKAGSLMGFNKVLSILLLMGVTFSIVMIVNAVTPDPGHDYTAVSGGVAQGDIIYGSGVDTLTKLTKDANATRYLSNTGATNNPAWAQVNLTNGVVNALTVPNGGTGATTFTTNGAILLGNTTAAVTPLASVAVGSVLISNGVGAAPVWGNSAIGQQNFTASGTYTPTAGTSRIIVQMWGAGGAGGSCTNVAGCASGGGGSGGYVEYYSTAPVSGAVTLNAAGAAVAGATGGNGGTTTLVQGATTITANGGLGGVFIAGTAAIKFATGGAGAAISTNGTVNGAGNPGANGMTSTVATIGNTGAGGATSLGGGGVGVRYITAAAVVGVAAVANTGSGGSGGGTGAATVAAGGAGALGRVIVWEFR